MASTKQQLLGLLLGLLLSHVVAGQVNSHSARPRRQLPSSFLFGEEQLESAATTDSCERVRRGAMLCMLCRDAKSNAKYEQCSYAPTARPHQQPNHHQQPNNHQQPNRHQQQARAPKPRKQSLTYRYPGYSVQPSSSSQEDEASTYSDSVEAEEAEETRPRGCKTVQSDDGESCTVCTDPKTGAKSERCNYAFKPKDKAYAYTKSKSFGYPHSSGKKSRKDEEDSEQEQSPERLSSSVEAESSSASAEDSSSDTPDYVRSESERISKQLQAADDDCREEKRDSMVCRICKDPRSGDDLEQCNYSYEPDDKHYEYSKSKSFGNYRPDSYEPQESRLRGSLHEAKQPAKNEDKSSRVDGGFQDASRRRSEIEKIVAGMKLAKRSDCSKSYRNGMTCYSCKDREGLSDEECVFVSDDQAPAASRSRRQTSSSNDKKEEEEEESSGDYDKPVYDKVLGLRLPAYMLQRSASERDFDRSFKH